MAKAVEEESDLDRIRKRLTKTLGEGYNANPSIKGYLSSGSLCFDLSTKNWMKVGGFPEGKPVVIFGQPNAGKSTVALRAAKECQSKNGLVIFFNTNEQGFDPEWAVSCGVNVAEDSPNWLLVNTFTLEGNNQGLEDVVKERCESHLPTLIICDSLSALTLAADTMDGKSAKEKSSLGGNSKAMHAFFRRGILRYMSGSRIVLLLILHQTESPEPFSKGDITTHGSAPTFYSWMRLKVTCTDMEDPDGGKLAGAWVKVKICRSKIGTRYHETSMPLYFNRGFDEGLEIVYHLLGVGVLKKNPQGYVAWEGKNLYVKELVKLYWSSEAVREKLRELVICNGNVKIVEGKKTK